MGYCMYEAHWVIVNKTGIKRVRVFLQFLFSEYLQHKFGEKKITFIYKFGDSECLKCLAEFVNQTLVT